MRSLIGAAVLLLVGLWFATASTAQDVSGFNLAPGEILVSVDGVAVGSQQTCANGRCTPIANVVRGAVAVATAPVRAVVAAAVVNRSQAAYEHAEREAAILAQRQTYGHPLGVAPGCRYSGTGTSFSVSRPNHCYLSLGDGRLVARAVVRGRDGRFYWSAHYR